MKRIQNFDLASMANRQQGRNQELRLVLARRQRTEARYQREREPDRPAKDLLRERAWAVSEVRTQGGD